MVSDLLRGEETGDGSAGRTLKEEGRGLSPSSSLPLAPGSWSAEFAAGRTTD